MTYPTRINYGLVLDVLLYVLLGLSTTLLLLSVWLTMTGGN